MNKWFLKESPSGKFYTPFSSSKQIAKVLGADDTPPTPRQLADWFNASPDNSTITSALIGIKSTREASTEAIDLPPGVYIHREGDYNVPERTNRIRTKN